jgi:hypothetical protein
VGLTTRTTKTQKIEQVGYPQDIPLNIPKKTKLYIEQTQREKDQSIDMHRIFQVFSRMRTHTPQYEDTYLVVCGRIYSSMQREKDQRIDMHRIFMLY